MNKKGQALVEFIIIMPVFIMLLLAVFDFTKIMQTKMHLESLIEDITLDKDYKLSDDIILSTKKDDEYIEYTLVKKVEIISPFVSAFLHNHYDVVVSRSIYAK